MNWKRARTDERKNERKEAIYEAAYTLFKTKGYDKVSFNGIASEAGFTKSNMYRYFSSKEEIFLNVFASLFEQWFDNYCARLQKCKENESVDNFTKAWVSSFSEHPKLMDLMPILFSSLEKNSSYEQLQAFKRLSKNLLYRITLEIGRIYPSVQGEKAFRFLNLGYAATVNSWTANTQSEALKKLYQEEEFRDLKPNFEYDLSESITIVIRGLILE